MNNKIIALFVLCYYNKWGLDKSHLEFDNQQLKVKLKIKS